MNAKNASEAIFSSCISLGTNPSANMPTSIWPLCRDSMMFGVIISLMYSLTWGYFFMMAGASRCTQYGAMGGIMATRYPPADVPLLVSIQSFIFENE